jgi:DNA-binding NarL/FixJ family response regulator
MSSAAGAHTIRCTHRRGSPTRARRRRRGRPHTSPANLNPPSQALTTLLVDDHERFRSAARAELEAGGFRVVAELDRAADALAAAVALQPDVALLDIRLPDGDGVDLADEIAHTVPDTAVVVISGMAAEDARERLAAAGSSASFLPKAGFSASALRAIVSA